MKDGFYTFLLTRDTPVYTAAQSLYEQVCSDVNPKQTIPGPPCCTQELDENEYFDEQTVSDEVLAQCHAAKTGRRAAVYPSAGRTSLGIMGNGFPENVCASSSSSSAS